MVFWKWLNCIHKERRPQLKIFCTINTSGIICHFQLQSPQQINQQEKHTKKHTFLFWHRNTCSYSNMMRCESMLSTNYINYTCNDFFSPAADGWEQTLSEELYDSNSTHTIKFLIINLLIYNWVNGESFK